MEPLSRTTTSDQPSSTRLRRVAVALGGVLAGGFGLGLAELIAGTSPRFRSPVLDVGDRVIDRVPAALKDVAIALFGTNDKIALLVGIGTVLAVYAAALGLLMLAGRRRLAIGGVVLFGIAGSASALGSRSGKIS